MTTRRSSQGRGAMRPGIALAVALAASALRSDPAAAQFDPGIRDRQEPKPKTETCEETVTRPLPVQDGIVQVRIVSPCRQGQNLTIQTDDATFDAAFDKSGVLNAQVPIFRDPAAVRWQGPDGRPREEQVRFPNLQRMLRIVLIWKGDLTLSLRVNEALTTLPGARCRWFRRGDACSGLGRFEAPMPAPGPGTHVETYTLPPQVDTSKGGLLPYRVYFDSRVRTKAGIDDAYCSSGPLSNPTFSVWVLKNGTATRDRRQTGFGTLPCGDVGTEPSEGTRSDVILGP